jgi:hypothetical protein
MLSGHAVNADAEQRLLNAVLMMLVVMALELTPGANADVADVIGVVQAEKLLLLFRLTK